MRNEIEVKVKEILAGLEGMSVNVDDISLDTELTSLGLDSITYIKFTIALEAEYGFEFDDQRIILKNSITIRDVVDYIESNMQG